MSTELDYCIMSLTEQSSAVSDKKVKLQIKENIKSKVYFPFFIT